MTPQEKREGGCLFSSNLIFTTSVSVRKGRGQQAVIQVSGMMTNGPIRVKQANQSSAVIGQYV